MKKNLEYLLVVTLIYFYLVGCGTKKLTEEHDNIFEISLYVNRSSGYNWTYKVNKNDMISIEESYDDSECESESKWL